METQSKTIGQSLAELEGISAVGALAVTGCEEDIAFSTSILLLKGKPHLLITLSKGNEVESLTLEVLTEGTKILGAKPTVRQDVPIYRNLSKTTIGGFCRAFITVDDETVELTQGSPLQGIKHRGLRPLRDALKAI